MLKPDKGTIDRWIKSNSIMQFGFKSGQIRKGIINGCYGLGMHVNFGVADKKVVTFDSLDSITEEE